MVSPTQLKKNLFPRKEENCSHELAEASSKDICPSCGAENIGFKSVSSVRTLV